MRCHLTSAGPEPHLRTAAPPRPPPCIAATAEPELHAAAASRKCLQPHTVLEGAPEQSLGGRLSRGGGRQGIRRWLQRARPPLHANRAAAASRTLGRQRREPSRPALGIAAHCPRAPGAPSVPQQRAGRVCGARGRLPRSPARAARRPCRARSCSAAVTGAALGAPQPGSWNASRPPPAAARPLHGDSHGSGPTHSGARSGAARHDPLAGAAAARGGCSRTAGGGAAR